MSRGRPRHHGSRRRAYSGRQREVRERRVRLARADRDWLLDEADLVEPEPAADRSIPPWALRLLGRATAA